MSYIKLFKNKQVRSQWNEKEKQWYFAIIDIIEILTESKNPRRYWSDIKRKLNSEGVIQLYEIIVQLKVISSDGKKYATDCADVKGLLRIIQSIPSLKAEPFKQWLAKVGYERMQEISVPEQNIDRARENYQNLGRSEKWIQQRITEQETRNKHTDYWKDAGIKEKDKFALLTKIIHQEWKNLTVKKHKVLKGLKTQNSHINEAELIFTALAEHSTRQFAETSLMENAKANKKKRCLAKNVQKK